MLADLADFGASVMIVPCRQVRLHLRSTRGSVQGHGVQTTYGESSMARKVAKGKRGVRCSAEKKAEILAAAKKDGLTGEQVAKRFGVSTLTFYRWRGPVRGRKRGRPVGSKNRLAGTRVKVSTAALRREVQAQLRKLLPQIIREEVAAALKG